LVGTRYTGRSSLTGRLSEAPLTAPNVNEALPGSRASGKNISGGGLPNDASTQLTAGQPQTYDVTVKNTRTADLVVGR
jgi:hypothetical protein